MSKIIVDNRKARFDYHIEDKIETGIELQGWEVKSARAGEVNLLDSFVFFSNGECWLKNAHFSPYKDGRVQEQESKRNRKLLLRKSQIEKLHMQVKAKGYTCVVTKLYFNPRGLVKAEIALARGKQNYDKKATLRERDIKRETERALRQ